MLQCRNISPFVLSVAPWKRFTAFTGHLRWSSRIALSRIQHTTTEIWARQEIIVIRLIQYNVNCCWPRWTAYISHVHKLQWINIYRDVMSQLLNNHRAPTTKHILHSPGATQQLIFCVSESPLSAGSQLTSGNMHYFQTIIYANSSLFAPDP